MKKKIIFSIIGIILAGTAAAGTSIVKADWGNSRSLSIISKIAQKFGLKEADVKAVFDEERAGRIQIMLDRYSRHLDQEVADNKITAAQKELILAKRKELINKREYDQNQNLTWQERYQNKLKYEQELLDWAKANNINMEYVLGGFGGRGMMMGRGGGRHIKGY